MKQILPWLIKHKAKLSSLASALLVALWITSFWHNADIGFRWIGERLRIHVTRGRVELDNDPQIQFENKLNAPIQKELTTLGKKLDFIRWRGHFKPRLMEHRDDYLTVGTTFPWVYDPMSLSGPKVAPGTYINLSDTPEIDVLRIDLDAEDCQRQINHTSALLVPVAPRHVHSNRYLLPILAALLTLPALWPTLRKLRPPPPPGICLTCGYDLRATPHRCPECGTVPQSSNEKGIA